MINKRNFYFHFFFCQNADKFSLKKRWEGKSRSCHENATHFHKGALYFACRHSLRSNLMNFWRRQEKTMALMGGWPIYSSTRKYSILRILPTTLHNINGIHFIHKLQNKCLEAQYFNFERKRKKGLFFDTSYFYTHTDLSKTFGKLLYKVAWKKKPFCKPPLRQDFCV